MADRVGQQWGNYRLARRLATGGFAEVYLGEHIYLKSQAALKLLFSSSRDEKVEQFRTEAEILVSLRHPHIVRMLEFTVEREIPVLIMDYAPGGTVRKRHTEGSSLSLVTVVAYVKQVAAALQYAHNHRIIHRDVKPENILFDADQQILLSDFGLALLAPSPELLSTQERAGTRAYIPPEQWDGNPTFASDQYALGITTYEWLCGERPFRGDPWALEYQHKEVAPPSLRERCPGLPAAVEEVVFIALKKDPKQRFANIQAFANALEQASQESVQARPQPDPLRSPLPDQHTSHDSPSLPQARRRVFLTAAPADHAFAAHLQADLQARGIAVVNDNTPIAYQQEALQQAIRDVDLVLVVVSPYTPSSRTVKEPLRIATIYRRRLVFVRVTDDEPASVIPETWGRTALIDQVDARETRYQAALDEIMAFLKEAASTSKETDLPVPPGEPRNPYKGLQAFTERDAANFFGRDTLIAELAEALEGILTAEKPAPASRLLTVVGPSGSGKSSVVMAGLLPALRKGVLSGSEAWVYLAPIAPGQHPLESLALAFVSQLPHRSPQSIRENLEDDAARGLHLLATQLVKQPGARVMLIVDQFEELFTQIVSEAERQRFIDLLVTAVTEPQGPLIVLLTLRADFYDRPMQYRQLSQLIEAHRTPVLPMGPHELRAVIEQPALLPDVQLIFEGNLVGDLLFEMQGQHGALPLLEFTLDQLFQRREGHVLTIEAYREIGGVKGALANHAESTYASLPSEDHRCLARALFLRLIDPGVTEQDTTRRRALRPELVLDNPVQTRLLQETVDAFIAARLLTTNEIIGTTTVEVSHEALIREWKRLANWLGEAREDIHLQQAISEAVAQWERRGMPRDRLYRGSQLKEAHAWAKRNVPSRQEVAFLQASTRHRVQSALSIATIVLLLLSTTALASWFLLRQPDPTRVTTSADAGTGSLRWAIVNAPTGSTITFDPSLMKSVILLTSNDLTFTKSLTLRGPGAQSLAISGGKSGHIVRVLAHITVAIFNLSFINSNTGQSKVGFIENEGTLTLTNSTVSGNRSSFLGGGIYNNGGNLTLVNSTVSRNSAQYGGGIYNEEMSDLTLIHSTISENVASDVGGGIYDYVSRDHQSLLISCTISGNTAAHDGGGILVEGSHPAEARKCRITGNHAPMNPDIAGNIIQSQ